MMETRICIIDDEVEVGEALADVLRSEGYTVRYFRDPTQFLETFEATGPTCVLTDLRMPLMNGLELVQALTERRAPVSMVVLTAYADVPTTVEIMQSGGHAVLEKSSDRHHIVDAVRRSSERAMEIWSTTQAHRGVHDRLKTLTDRERQVLDLVISGKPSKLIADDLGISINTVEVHRSRVMQKMQAGSVADLVRMVVAAVPRLGQPQPLSGGRPT